QPRGIALGHLGPQVCPLQRELPVGERQAFDPGRQDDARAVEPVAARVGGVGEPVQPGGDPCDRVGERAEALELRMTAIALGQPAEYLLGQEPLAPPGDQRGAVEQDGIDAPQAHPASIGADEETDMTTTTTPTRDEVMAELAELEDARIREV